MIEANVHSGTDDKIDKIIENQEKYIDRIVEDIVKQAKKNLYILVDSEQINSDDVDVYNNEWNYLIAKAMVNIAIQDVNKKWPTNCHFNSKCKKYKEIIKEEIHE